MTRIGEEEMSKVIGQWVTSRRLGYDNGNMWWNLPCCSSANNLCFSMFNEFLVAVILASREIFKSLSFTACFRSLSSVSISPFNFRISPSISSRVVIADCFLIFTDLSEFEVQERKIWLPKCEGNDKKQLLILLSQVKWYNYDHNRLQVLPVLPSANSACQRGTGPDPFTT